MDRAGDGVSALTAPRSIDLHLHSTASDGMASPGTVVERAVQAGLSAIALTDHDTTAGIAAARDAGRRAGVRVISGCEFSVAAPEGQGRRGGELHVLGYFLPVGAGAGAGAGSDAEAAALERFLAERRSDRYRRAETMVSRLNDLGVAIDFEQVLAAAQAEGGAGGGGGGGEDAAASVGRPHVAQALLGARAVSSIQDAFDRYLGWGMPAFVAKTLPAFRAVAELVHQVGGLVSAAHLKWRGTRRLLRRLRDEGLDAVETRHPSHTPEIRARLTDLALELGLARTGGSDWHGDALTEPAHASIGSQAVPEAWLEELEARRVAGGADD